MEGSGERRLSSVCSKYQGAWRMPPFSECGSSLLHRPTKTSFLGKHLCRPTEKSCPTNPLRCYSISQSGWYSKLTTVTERMHLKPLTITMDKVVLLIWGVETCSKRKHARGSSFPHAQIARWLWWRRLPTALTRLSQPPATLIRECCFLFSFYFLSIITLLFLRQEHRWLHYLMFVYREPTF